MTWGVGEWGSEAAWGTGLTLSPPSIVGVSPYIVERRGGTVVTIVGTNFFDPMTVEVLKGAVVVGEGVIFDARFDLQQNRAYVGLPAAADGVYGIRVSTAGGDSPIFENAVEYRLHTEQVKVHRVRIGYAQPWVTGPRLLTNNTTGLKLG